MNVNMTTKEMGEIKRMIRSAVDNAIKDRINGMEEKVDAIYNILVGDEKFNVVGMKEEHDEMYEEYKGARWFIKNIKTILAGFVAMLLAFVAWVFNLISK